MSDSVIQTDGLTVFYGKHRGIINLDLDVKKGEVFGFLGPNGAGKTTAIRVLLDIIRPTKGSASIFGMDCQKDSLAIRQRLSYVPGELFLPDTMRGRQYLDMVNSLRSKPADKKYIDELCERLDLDRSRRIKNYSKGNKQKLGLVGSLMNKPDLLILDEPTSGLDPLVQQTVLSLVKEAKEEGRTVFFSSHILSEAQAVADRVGIIREGRIAAVERVDTLTEQSFRRIKFRFEQMPAKDVFDIDGVKELTRMDDAILLEVRDNMPAVMTAASEYQILDIETPPVSLEEIFLTYYGEANDG